MPKRKKGNFKPKGKQGGKGKKVAQALPAIKRVPKKGVIDPAKQRRSPKNDGNSSNGVSPTPGKEIAKMIGDRGTVPIGDTRVPSVSSLIAKDMTNIIERTVQINERAVYMTSLGVILQSIRHGAQYPDIDLYQAYMYLASLLVSAFQGDKIEGVQLPWQIWELVAAFGPKKVPFKTGEIDYSAEIVPGTNLTYRTPRIEYNDTAGSIFSINLGAINPAFSSSAFPSLSQVIPAYDAAAGAQALGRIWSKMGVTKLYTLQDYTPLLGTDVSAYASVITEMGLCYDSPGGIRTAISEEVWVDSPILAHYSQETKDNQTLGERRRGFQNYKPGGMGPLYVGSRIMEFTDPKEFYNKSVPAWKVFDLWNGFERFSLILCRLQETAQQDNTARGLGPWPLTAQKTAILIRYIVMSALDGELGADVSQYTTDSNEVAVIPCAPGMGQTYRTPVNLTLPSFLCENIRTMRRHLVSVGNGILDEVPVLGTSAQFYNLFQYEWQDALGAYVPLFPADVDPVINMVDGSMTDNNIKYWLDLDGNEMGAMVTAANTWLKAYSSYSSELEEFSDESATYALAPTYFTCHQQTIIPIQLPQATGNSSASIGDLSRIGTPRQPVGQQQLIARTTSKKKIAVGTSIRQKVKLPRQNQAAMFQNTAIVGVTGNFRPLSAAWKYQKIQWLPSRWTNYDASFQEKGIAWYQTQMEEPAYCSMVLQPEDLLEDDGLTYTTNFDRNLKAAEVDIKSKQSEASEWQKDCNELQWKGEGGLFSKIADMFGTVIGIPEIGHFVEKFGLP